MKYDSKYDISDLELLGIVQKISFNGNKLSMQVLGEEKVIVNYYLQSEEEKNYYLDNLHLGDTIYLIGTFKEVINNTIPNTFNYKKYLYNKKIYYLFNANSLEIKENSNPFYKIKDYILKRAYKLDNSEYFLLFILGDKTLLNSEDYHNFQSNGISHLFAISGMHIGIIIAIFDTILKKAKWLTKIIFLSIFLFFFAFITSFSASVIRAILFFLISKLNKRFNWSFNSLQILFIVGFIILVINPFMIYDLGFLYSFLVTFGIIYYQDKITGNYMQKLFKLSIVANLFSFPITVAVNYEINLLSIFNNLIFVPLITFLIYPFSLIAFIFPTLNPIFRFLLKILKNLNKLFSHFTVFLNVPKMPLIVIFIFIIILLLIKYNKKLWILLITIILIVKIIPKIDSSYYVYYLDVGQGDSSILVTPYQKYVVMIDTGGVINFKTDDWKMQSNSYNVSDNSILFLKSLGITKIDYLILSHGDYDHMGEASNIVDKFKIRKVIFNLGEYNELELDLIKILSKEKIKHYSGLKELTFDKYRLQFLNTNVYDNENENSNVLYFKVNDYKFLFMGDAGIKKEKDILVKFNLKNIDFLKVGHHGSKTSSSENFINEMNPQYSIISVGNNNRYGHPNKEVLNDLEQSKIYRTDQDGSIMFKINNNKLKIETCSP